MKKNLISYETKNKGLPFVFEIAELRKHTKNFNNGFQELFCFYCLYLSGCFDI